MKSLSNCSNKRPLSLVIASTSLLNLRAALFAQYRRVIAIAASIYCQFNLALRRHINRRTRQGEGGQLPPKM